MTNFYIHPYIIAKITSLLPIIKNSIRIAQNLNRYSKNNYGKLPPMIYDSLENAARYYSLHPLFQQAFAALQDRNWNQLECGRYDILGEQLFVNLAEYQTFLPDQGKWEAHRKYIDIQLIIEGEERMGHAFINTLQVLEPYNEAQDVEFLSGTGQLISYRKSTFAIYFPHDGHKPGIITEAPSTVRKAVAKILI